MSHDLMNCIHSNDGYCMRCVRSTLDAKNATIENVVNERIKVKEKLATIENETIERCAKVCLAPKDDLRIEWMHAGNRACAAAIRALKDAP